MTDNVIAHNGGQGGIFVTGDSASVTVAANTVSGNASHGVRQRLNAVVKTRSNNVVQDNVTDTAGNLTFIAGD